MKLEDKIMKLRKENAWSQEELADKLDVSRQTISKWELGQTTPDTDNLSKMASLFGISVNDLLDDSTNPIEGKSKTSNNNNTVLKVLLIIFILIVIFISICAIAINKIFNKVTNQLVPKSIIEMFEQYSINDIFDTITGKMEESEEKSDYNAIMDKMEESRKASEKKLNNDLFNTKFKTLYQGTIDGFFMNSFIDTVIQSNEDNSENIITVNYEGIETSDSSELRNMKNQISNSNQYTISYEYDENGLICKAIIKKAD